MFLGNPFTDYNSNTIAMFDKFWGVNVVSKDMYQKWRSQCAKRLTEYAGTWQCYDYENKMFAQLGIINPYALDYPVCNIGGQTSPQGVQLLKVLNKVALGANVGGSRSAKPAYARCAKDYMSTYLNNADTKRALHVKLSREWAVCSDAVNAGYDVNDITCSLKFKVVNAISSPNSCHAPLDASRSRNMVPKFKQILDEHPKQRILIFSGDNDAQWRLDDQPAGYVTKFKGGALAFVTVHSAGHEVPAYQPERALVVLERYLDGSWFAKKGN
ncbi:Alpha/Beta hydrolase protein [Tribonema minus]|uniref:Alpha/Beta hydrolase protein n=1 Tax=Tribonema minus TaxID=303371 RepID=A0A835YVV9_9STRA|nr:Alpha/Beta hydrolase protein [Tribonema minus]